MKTIKIKLNQITLNADQLANLASEFYGKSCETMTDEYEILFEDIAPEGAYSGDTDKSLSIQFLHAVGNYSK